MSKLAFGHFFIRQFLSLLISCEKQLATLSALLFSLL